MALFTPQREFSAGSPPAELWMRFNPNARCPPTTAMRTLFEGAQTFHDASPGDLPPAQPNVG